jgi:ribosome-associated protein YbcJ (S4-like RNA binding protein)
VTETLSRRDFIRRASLAPLGAPLGGAALAQPPIKRAGGAKLKLSLNAYSFNKALNDHIKGRGKGMTLFDLLDYCAEQDFDAIDPTGYFFPGYPRVPSDKYLNDFKRRAFVLGLDISGTGIRNDFASPDRERRAADVRHAREWIEAAARMGAPVLRVFAGPEPAGHPREKVVEWMVEALKSCVEHAKKYGVLVGIQNHGDMLKTAEDVLEVVKKVDSEWFGVIVDTGLLPHGGPVPGRRPGHALRRQLADQGAAGGEIRQGQDGPEEAGGDHPQGRLPGVHPHRDALRAGAGVRPAGPGRGVPGGAAPGAARDGGNKIDRTPRPDGERTMADAPQQLPLRGDHITLAQAVKAAGLADTGGQAKHLVRGGGVAVNGAPETQPGRKLRAGDRFAASGQEWVVVA